jgi:hypothetical protein
MQTSTRGEDQFRLSACTSPGSDDPSDSRLPPYSKPEVLHEVLLEARAGSPLYDDEYDEQQYDAYSLLLRGLRPPRA